MPKDEMEAVGRGVSTDVEACAPTFRYRLVYLYMCGIFTSSFQPATLSDQLSHLILIDDGDGDEEGGGEVLTRRVDNAAKWHPARTRLVARITRRPRRRWHHEAAASYL